MIKTVSILTIEDIDYLKRLQRRLPKKYLTQDINLFNVYKSYVPGNERDMWQAIHDKLLTYHGKKCETTNYFLQYEEGSEAKIHKDNPVTVEGTAVTLLEKTDNLVGGDIIIPTSNVDFTVVPQEVGETVYYNTDTFHGVSKVVSGTRKVLITWFRKETWQS